MQDRGKRKQGTHKLIDLSLRFYLIDKYVIITFCHHLKLKFPSTEFFFFFFGQFGFKNAHFVHEAMMLDSSVIHLS